MLKLSWNLTFLHIILTCICAVLSNKMHPLSDEFIENINTEQNLWTAGRNFHRLTPYTYFKRLMGSIKDYDNLTEIFYDQREIKLPINFDGRHYWQYCPTLNDIRDQGSCGSCWAVSTASAITDRTCIHSNGSKNFYFSADDILTCCTKSVDGCNGGKLKSAWSYYTGSGIVSGGHYNSSEGCKPYEIEPCKHKVVGEREKCGNYVSTPACNKTCIDSYNVKYKKDKKKGKIIYRAVKIEQEIYLNGPVTSSFSVYDDFLNYKKGIYKYLKGDYIGEHAVKIIGWGVEHGTKYWLIANSWNNDWGDNGFFKILRGSNHCDIENFVIAGK